MEENESPQEVIDKYQRRQQFAPFIIGGLAILLIMIGVIILIVWLAGPNRPALGFLSTNTPTPTMTYTVTITPSPTETQTPTLTATLTETPTETPTASGPFEYVVQGNDTCWGISQKFKVDLPVLQAINNFGNGCPIHPLQKILIPAPGQKLPTSTPFPTGGARGAKIQYTIQVGDTLASIAAQFNANIEDIKTDNKITDPNKLFAGEVLTIKTNMVTPTKTMAPTSTPAPTKVGTQAATVNATVNVIATVTATKAP
jgi:LysM repeat protein